MPRTKTFLAALTVAACLPYLTLKLTWLSGGTVGIPERSPLLDGGGTLWVLNAVTVAMDATVILLVLVLTRPWGLRLPPPLLLLPLWAATGLLGPIVVTFPAQAVYRAVAGGGDGRSGGTGPEDVLDGWVWTVVYTGFTLQALALGTLFALYVRARWGALLRTRLGSLALPAGERGTWRPAFALGTALALGSGVPHVVWATGSDAGLRAGSGDAAGVEGQITDSAFALFTVAAVTGVRLLARGERERRYTPRGSRLIAPLAAAWAGTGVMACWGLWLLLGALTGGGQAVGQRTTGFLELAYACQALAGLVLAALGTHLLRRRADAAAADRTGTRAA